MPKCFNCRIDSELHFEKEYFPLNQILISVIIKVVWFQKNLKTASKTAILIDGLLKWKRVEIQGFFLILGVTSMLKRWLRS